MSVPITPSVVVRPCGRARTAASLSTCALLVSAALGVTGAAVAVESDEDPALDQTIDPDQDVVFGETELTVGHIDIGPRYLTADETADEAADEGTDGADRVEVESGGEAGSVEVEPEGGADEAADEAAAEAGSTDGQVDAERAWTLMIHDDQSYDDDAAESVWRHPDETVLRVHDTALLPVPEGEGYEFLGVAAGEEVHVIPQTQDPEVVWLGWNTQDPEVMDTIDRGVTMSLVGVEGPGDLVVYLQSGAFEEPDVLWDNRIDEPQPAWIPVNTHTHANWVFTEPGVHLVHLEITAELVDGTTVSDTRALRFAVGDEVTVDETLAAEPDLPVLGEGEAADEDAAGDEQDSTDGAADDAADDAASAEDETGVANDSASPIVWIAIAGAVLLVVAGLLAGLRARRSRARAFAARTTNGHASQTGDADRTKGRS